MMRDGGSAKSGDFKTYSFGYATNGLTPHPGPLPVEGRGGAPISFLRVSQFAAFVALELVGPIRSVAKQTRWKSSEFQQAPNATPSPLNGERAGVRGEIGAEAEKVTSPKITLR